MVISRIFIALLQGDLVMSALNISYTHSDNQRPVFVGGDNLDESSLLIKCSPAEQNTHNINPALKLFHCMKTAVTDSINRLRDICHSICNSIKRPFVGQFQTLEIEKDQTPVSAPKDLSNAMKHFKIHTNAEMKASRAQIREAHDRSTDRMLQSFAKSLARDKAALDERREADRARLAKSFKIQMEGLELRRQLTENVNGYVNRIQEFDMRIGRLHTQPQPELV